MMARSHFAIAAAALFLLSAAAHAQETATPATLGGFETQGSATAGYRFLDTSGRREKYLELFDLRKGFRVNEFELMGRAPEKGNGNRSAAGIRLSSASVGRLLQPPDADPDSL